jgi:transposase-like protein
VFISGTGFKTTSNENNYFKKNKNCVEYIIDEIVLKVGRDYIGLLIAIDAKSKEILALLLLKILKKERNMLIAERLIFSLIKTNGEHLVSTDGEVIGTNDLGF